MRSDFMEIFLAGKKAHAHTWVTICTRSVFWFTASGEPRGLFWVLQRQTTKVEIKKGSRGGPPVRHREWLRLRLGPYIYVLALCNR